MPHFTIRRSIGTQIDDRTVHADTIGELYTSAARSFEVENENSIRLIFRGRVLERSDEFVRHDLADGATILMTVGHNPSNPNSNQNSATPPNSSGAASGLPDTLDIMRLLETALGNGRATVVVGRTSGPNFSGVPEAVPAPPPSEQTPNPVEGVPLASGPQGVAGAVSGILNPLLGALRPPGTIPAQSPSPFTPVAGVYLHVHCNLDEVESVPQRLERIRHLMPRGAPMTVIPNPPIPLARPPQQQQQQQPPQPQPQQQHRDAPASSAERSASDSPNNNENPYSGNEGDTSYQHPINSVLNAVISSLDLPNYLQLAAGNWSALYPVREPLRQALQENEDELDPQEQAQALYDTIFKSEQATAIIEEGHDASTSSEQVIVPWLKEFFENAIEALNFDGDSLQWGSRLRQTFVRYIGGTFHYTSAWLGRERAERLFSSSVEEGIQNLRSVNPIMIVALRGAMSGQLHAWATEYSNSLHRDGDAVFQPPHSATEANLTNDELDRMLDDADSLLEEVLAEAEAPSNDETVVEEWSTEIRDPSGAELLRRILSSQAQACSVTTGVFGVLRDPQGE